MIELALVGTIVALLTYMAWERYETRKEHAKLINALVSKTSQEMRDLEFVDKVQLPKVEKPEPQFIDPGTLSDEEWVEKVTNA